MTFDPSRWKQYTALDTAIWLHPEQPSWFVPNRAAAEMLRDYASHTRGHDPAMHLLLQRLPKPVDQHYLPQRNQDTDCPPLHELWLHLTDRCNLACSHCLFCSGPDQARELPLAIIKQHIDAALTLGCRLFALTGGEPLVHPDFTAIVEHILEQPDCQVVILTNGLLASERLSEQWPRARVFLQISLDGVPEHHDRLRGNGSFDRLQQQLLKLHSTGWQFTLSCCVTRENAVDLPWLVDYAADHGAMALHLMWHFLRGRGTSEQHTAPAALVQPVLAALQQADQRGILIDNIENLKTQIFSPPGTIHDGSSAGRESAAVGPDNRLYPSAATIGFDELASSLADGLVDVWYQSAVLKQIRCTSAADLADPWRFLLGGGDFDHCYHHDRSFIGNDPYQPLHEQLALHLITQAACRLPEATAPGLRLKMGELLVSCGNHDQVARCHSNCLLSHQGLLDSRSQVASYYADAAGDKRLEILNPVHYDDQMIEHIPAAYRFRGYGCGSPVLDAGLKPGERMVDLGCGSGVECFIAARLVGKNGQVTGIDMLEPMLALARKGAADVRQALGFDNLHFSHGYLEALPLADNQHDLVVSNCVLNLSADKRRTFAEIWRVLAPGGRLVAADVVCEQEPDAAILNDATLRGECISGALTQKDLLGILEESGFCGFRVLKRLPYRVVNNHPFFSLTFVAYKPQQSPGKQLVSVLYPGPAAMLQTEEGTWLRPGQTVTITQQDAALLGEQVWQLDQNGFVSNVPQTAGANCCLPPEGRESVSAPAGPRHDSGCLVCGAPLTYFSHVQTSTCHYCGKELPANACCEQGHFVCDNCHTGDALGLIEHLCATSSTSDPISLFREIRLHPSIPLHGPQYHALVPGVLVACLRTAGHPVTPEQLHSAIQRGGEISGGSCGFSGVCGAASGVGIAFSVLLEATPLKAKARQQVQQVVQQVLAEIAGFEAARCCQRDCWVALRSGMQLARTVLSLELPEPQRFACSQMARNKECLGMECPLWP